MQIEYLNSNVGEYNYIPRVKHKFAIFLCFAACTGLGLIVPAWFVFFGFVCLFFGYLGIVDTFSAVFLFLVLNPLTIFIRNSAPGNIILAGATSIWLFIIIIGWMLNVLQGKTKPVLFKTDVILLLMFMGWGVIVCLLSASVLRSFLGYRFMIFPCFLYIIVRSFVLSEPKRSSKLLLFLLLSAAALAVFQLLWYHDHIRVIVLEVAGVEANLALQGGSRSIFGITIGRMHSMIGGGPSNVAIYMMSGFWLGSVLITRKFVGLLKKFFILAFMLLCLYGSILAISRSVFLLIFVVMGYGVFASNLSKGLKLSFIAGGIVLFSLLVIGRGFAGESIIDSIIKNAHMWTQNIPSGIGAILGNGFYESGGGILRRGMERDYSLVDAGWVSVWYQVGLVGFLPIFLWIIYLVYSGIKFIKEKTYYQYDPFLVKQIFIGAAVSLGLIISSVHTAIISRLASNTMFFVLAAMFISLLEYKLEPQYDYDQIMLEQKYS